MIHSLLVSGLVSVLALWSEAGLGATAIDPQEAFRRAYLAFSARLGYRIYRGTTADAQPCQFQVSGRSESSLTLELRILSEPEDDLNKNDLSIADQWRMHIEHSNQARVIDFRRTSDPLKNRERWTLIGLSRAVPDNSDPERIDVAVRHYVSVLFDGEQPRGVWMLQYPKGATMSGHCELTKPPDAP
jgi:hypothetical protein